MKTYRPTKRVTLLTYASRYTQAIDLSSHVLTINTTKAYERGAGSWQMTFVINPLPSMKARIDQFVVSNDMVLIELDAGDGRGLVPVMRGLVDRVARTASLSGEGTPQRQVRLVGTDMGKLLLKHDIGWDINYIHSDLGVVGGKAAYRTIRSDSLTVSGTPGEIVSFIYEKYVQGGTAFDLDPTIASWINMEVDEKDNWHLKTEDIMTTTGPAWNAMVGYANLPWNVLYTETDVNGDFYVYHEQRPLDSNGRILSDTPVNLIDDSMIVTEDIGISDDERINYFFFRANLVTARADQNDIPFFLTGSDQLIWEDKTEIQRNGLNYHEEQTNFIPLANTMQECGTRAKTMWNWNRQNHLLQSGTFVVHGRPEISVGEAIKNTSSNEIFLLEQYEHSYTEAPIPAFLTTLYCTRGMSGGNQ